jgi:hypothetical protein
MFVFVIWNNHSEMIDLQFGAMWMKHWFHMLNFLHVQHMFRDGSREEVKLCYLLLKNPILKYLFYKMGCK